MASSNIQLTERLGPLAGNLDNLQSAVWDAARDPVLLELCRLQVAAMLHDEEAGSTRSAAAVAAGLDEAKVSALAEWHTSPLFDERERSYLDFTEQFVTSVRHVSDAQITSLCAHDDERDVCDFIAALYALELATRVSLVSRVVLAPEEAAA